MSADDDIHSLTENQICGATRMFWLATQIARRTLGLWALDDKGPPQVELLTLGILLKSAEDTAMKVARAPVRDDSAFDDMIATLQRSIAEVERRYQDIVLNERAAASKEPHVDRSPQT